MRTLVPTPSGRRSNFNDDHEAFRDSVGRFLEAELVPHLANWRHEDIPSHSVTVAAGRAGFLGSAVPELFGGGGTDDIRFLAVLLEEVVAVGATGPALLWALHSGVTIPCFLQAASDTTKRRWLPGLASGDLIGVPAAARSSATIEGGRLTGTLEALPGARWAHVLLVDLGNDSPGIAVVPVDQPGVAVTPVVTGIAVNDSGLADVELDGISPETILPCTVGFRRDLDLWLAVVALAGARTALSLGLEYAKSRKVFRSPLSKFENTRFRLAELAAELFSVTTHVDHCLVARIEDGLQSFDAAAARLMATALHDRAVDQSLQLHGGYGYMREYPIAQAYADARFLRVAGHQHSDPRHLVAESLGL